MPTGPAFLPAFQHTTRPPIALVVRRTIVGVRPQSDAGAPRIAALRVRIEFGGGRIGAPEHDRIGAVVGAQSVECGFGGMRHEFVRLARAVGQRAVGCYIEALLAALRLRIVDFVGGARVQVCGAAAAFACVVLRAVARTGKDAGRCAEVAAGACRRVAGRWTACAGASLYAVRTTRKGGLAALAEHGSGGAHACLTH